MSQSSSARPLGRGLSALLGPELVSSSPSPHQDQSQKIHQISIHDMTPGRYQPREIFDHESLESLKASIQEKGVIQPILVRPLKQGLSRYEIVGGERRWRAAKELGSLSVPVIVREMSDLEALETGLIDNIQRHDLNPLEEAQGFKRLMDEFNYTQEDLAKALGKSRSHIANAVRLLGLPEEIKEALQGGKISAGHARCLIGIKNSHEVLQKILQGGLNVRQTEKLVQQFQKIRNDSSRKNLSSDEDKDLTLLVEKLTEKLNRKVSLSLEPTGGGILHIHFKKLEQLDEILSGFSSSH